MTDDDRISRVRVAGHSVRSISKTLGTSVAEVNRAIDRWADKAISHKVRRHTLTLQLARLNELQALFYQRALQGDTQCGAFDPEDRRAAGRHARVTRAADRARLRLASR